MKNLVFIISLSLISTFVSANSTICKVEQESMIDIKGIAWDKSTLVAKVTDGLNNTHAGKVTLIRDHNDGEKINIFVKKKPGQRAFASNISGFEYKI
jgi:hypothetical protein